MANVQIPNLPIAISLDGSEQLEIVQSGSSRRTTTGTIAGLSLSSTGHVPPVYLRHSFIATAGQTTFSATYSISNVQVYVNGLLLSSSKYASTTGTSIVFVVALSAGDSVEIISWV